MEIDPIRYEMFFYSLNNSSHKRPAFRVEDLIYENNRLAKSVD